MALRGKKQKPKTLRGRSKPSKPSNPRGTPQQKPKGQYMTKKPVATWAIDSKMNRDNYPHSKAMKRKGYG
jgi:hypothetical protein